MIKWKRQSGSLIETNNRSETIKYALKSGWERLDSDAKEKIEAVEISVQPDKEVSIASANSKDDLARIVKEKTGKILDKRGSIEKVRVKAEEIISGNSG